jgi:hypothetical protein
VRATPQPEGGNWVLVQDPEGDQYYYNKQLGISKWELEPEEQQRVLVSSRVCCGVLCCGRWCGAGLGGEGRA